jgi:DnaJ-class molecular chaperone
MSEECWRCNGSGHVHEPDHGSLDPIECAICDGTGVDEGVASATETAEGGEVEDDS